MLESLNTGVFEYEKLSPEEMKSRGILGRLVGVMADTVNPTRNGRAYSAQLWENVFNNPIMKERIENKCCFGELGHPIDREETDMEKIAICMDALPKKDSDGKLQAVFNILDTPNGRILKTLCDYGCNIGISSRGSGDLIQDFDGNESVDPDTYNCEGWDAVLIPAVKEARLKYVTESLDKTRYKKSLRTRLQEAIEKADEDHKKTMTESLHTFLGEGIWDEINNDVEQPEAGPEPDEDFVNDLESNTENNNESEEDVLENPPDNDEDILDDESADDIEMDMDGQIDDLFGEESEPENKPNIYKGVDIVQDPDTGKFVCEINQETYVFNTEKNARIWIDMNEEDIQHENIKNDVGDAIDATIDAEDDKNTIDTEDTDKEDNISESLNEEQVGRDIHKEDKDADEVQHQEERKDDSDKKDKDSDKKVTITVSESLSSDWSELNSAEQSSVDSVISNISNDDITLDILEEVCQVASNMYNDANFSPEYENEEFYGEEADWRKVYKFILNNGSKYGIQIKENKDENTLKYSETGVTEEVDNIKSEVDSLQEMLEHNIRLEQKIIELQEKLSVSHAEETKLIEEVDTLKSKLSKLSQTNKENYALKEKIKKVEGSSTKLNESVNKNSQKVKKLTEQLSSAREERDSVKTELETLKEDYASLEKDSTQIKEQLNKRVDRQNKLLEKYQKITKNAVDKYINLQATNLGVRPAEIKNKLPEKFSFSEIDSICEELRDYKLNVSKLPFSTSKSLKEGNVRVTNLNRGLTPRNEMDELTDYDLKMLELFN